MWVSRVAVMSALVHSGVHGECWPQHVYGVAMYQLFSDKDYIMAKNVGKCVHAEDDIFDYFDIILNRKRLRTQKITLFLSSSPCQRCSQRIIAFLSTAKGRGIDLQIEVVISAFYKIRRPSCEKNPACQGHLPSENDHRTQMRGLQNLRRTPGILLRTTTNEDWENLGVTLGLSDIDLSKREMIDDSLRKDFRQLMSEGFALPRTVSPPKTSVNLSSYQSDVSLSTEPPQLNLSTSSTHLTLSTDPSRRSLSTDQ